MHVNVQVFENLAVDEIKSKIADRKPFVIRNCDIGVCKEKWSHEYVAKKVGQTPVKIHVSSNARMDFLTKNFSYKTLPFDELVLRSARKEHTDYFLDRNEYYYLRSLGSDPRGREVANFQEQYPGLANDLKVPDVFSKEDYFSSVFRVGSAGIQLWTHYDVMDNVLIQVRGRKKVVLWSPDEVENMYLIGDKSAVLDIENPDLDHYPKFQRATQYHCNMEPGDFTFIPALWFHNTLALDSGIAVNVFWKNLKHDLYNKKDPYGNKDLVPGEKAMQLVDNSLKALAELPKDYRNFYILRLIEKLKTNL